MISTSLGLRTALNRAPKLVASAVQKRAMHAEPKMAFNIMEDHSRSAVTSLSPKEDLIRERARLYSEGTVRPLVKKMDTEAQLDSQVIKGCYSFGLLGSEAPKEFGGSNFGFLASCIAVEELARVDPSVAVVADSQNTLITSVLMKWATPEQQREWIPRLAKDTIGSFCLSEWNCGSDAFAMKTTAEPVTGGFALNGSKAWISSADEAGMFIVLANANPAKGYKGITAFIVDRNTPGITVGKKQERTGLRAAASYEVTFRDCVVPAKNVLGVIGKGYKVAIESLNEERVGMAAQTLGIAQGAFDLTMPLVMKFRQQQLATHALARTKFQEAQTQLARAACDIATARLMVYNAARLKEEGKSFVQESSMANLISSEVAEKVTTMCSSLVTDCGEEQRWHVEKLSRDMAQHASMALANQGTTGNQLQTIANGILRMYQ